MPEAGRSRGSFGLPEIDYMLIFERGVYMHIYIYIYITQNSASTVGLLADSRGTDGMFSRFPQLLFARFACVLSFKVPTFKN